MFVVEIKAQVGDERHRLLTLQPIRDEQTQLRMRPVKLGSFGEPTIRQPIVVNLVFVFAPKQSQLVT